MQTRWVNWSATDVHARQLRLKFRNTGVRDLRAAQFENLQVGETTQMLQTGIRDLCRPEIQTLQIGETTQVLQAGVRDLCAVQIERLQVGESTHVPKDRVVGKGLIGQTYEYDVCESGRVLLPQRGQDTIMPPRRFRLYQGANLFKILQPRLLALRPPTNSEANGHQGNQ